MREAVKAYLSENLTISIEAGEDWDNFGSSNSYRVKVQVSLDGDVISEDSSSFSIGSN